MRSDARQPATAARYGSSKKIISDVRTASFSLDTAQIMTFSRADDFGNWLILGAATTRFAVVLVG
jgi:hypothetical protein